MRYISRFATEQASLIGDDFGALTAHLAGPLIGFVIGAGVSTAASAAAPNHKN